MALTFDFNGNNLTKLSIADSLQEVESLKKLGFEVYFPAEGIESNLMESFYVLGISEER